MGLQVLEGPRYPQIWFGDGMWVQLLRKRRIKDHKGRWGWLFLMKPSKELLKTYKEELREEVDKDSGLVYEWYPDMWIKILSDDPHTGKILVKCNFLGQPTTTLCLESADKDKTIEQLEMIIEVQSSGLASLNEKYDTALTNLKLHMDKNAEIFLSARRVAGRTKTEEEEATKEEDNA